jgi:gliding motility-associated-like protein
MFNFFYYLYQRISQSMKQLYSVFILLLLFPAVYSQRGNMWVFGNKAGLDFSSGVPVPTNYSQMNQLEGSSSISDTNGRLLFYSDGITVWNAVHTVMPNGNGLFGNYSSTQSSMIVPFPNDPRRYYVFTVDNIGGIHGLCYSVVNMDLDGGRGDIELKNVQLVTPACEKITSVNHCNGRDVWVITHKHNSDEYYAYLVTGTGVNPPVISHSGRPSPSSSLGYLKASPDGTKIAAAHFGVGLDLSNFNTVTGEITNRKALINATGSNPLAYGVEFSPNSKVLYVSSSKHNPVSGKYRYDVSQYLHLDEPVPTIIASRTELDTDSMIFITNSFSALQLGQDGKMYMTIFPGNRLAIINNPDVEGIACNYLRNGLQLTPGSSCGYGLPDFNQSYFKGSFSYSASCTNNDVSFYFTTPTNASGIQWDFGDPASGINNTSLLDSPVHTFSSPGLYEVKVITFLACRNDTLKKMVKVDPLLVNLGPDREFCGNTPFILNPQSGTNKTYLWQDNSTNPTFTANASGLYWVEVTNPENGCVKRDSIVLTYKPNPAPNLGNDTLICERTTSLLLDAGYPGAVYTWQDNSSNQTYLATRAGIYYVTIINNGCEGSDTISIQNKYAPRLYLGNDTAICDGMTLVLKPMLNHATHAKFLWSTGDTLSTIAVMQPGSYSLAVTNECGTAADGINVKQGVCKLYMPNGFTPNSDGKNDIFKPGYGENIISFSMEIYNRWGQKIYTSHHIREGWNGKFNGLLQPAGAYAWIIRYKVFNDSKEYIQSGTVTLIL